VFVTLGLFDFSSGFGGEVVSALPTKKKGLNEAGFRDEAQLK
jgi:hypothetical protein